MGSLLVFFTIGFSIGKKYATFITKNQESRPDKQLENNELKHCPIYEELELENNKASIVFFPNVAYESIIRYFQNNAL